MINRRHLTAGLAATLLASTARAQTQALLRVSTAAPPGDFLSKSLEAFKAAVDGANAGVKVEVYPASTLFRQGAEVQALQRGNLEMSTMTTFEVAQQLPEHGYFNRAYLFRDYTHMRHVFDGPIGAEYRAIVAAKMGIEILATAYLGTRHVALAKRRAVKGPADLAGLKLRMPAGPEWLLLGKTLGVSPVPMGMPDVYLGLKTGTIDGQENPLSIFNFAKLYEVSEQVILTTHMLQPVFTSVAKPAWDKLTPVQQKIVRDAAVAAAKVNDDARLADEATVAEAIKTKGVTVDKIDLAPFRAAADVAYGQGEVTAAWDKAWLKRVLETA